MGIIWGIPYLLIKVAIAEVTPLTLVFLRCSVGAAVLVPIAAWRGSLTPLRPYWGMLLAYTAVEVAIPWVLLSWAETRVSSSLTGLLIGAVPLCGVLLARLVGTDENFTGRRLAGLLIGLAGVAAVVGFNVSGHDLAGIGALVVVAVGYAAGPMIISRRLQALPGEGVIAFSLAVPAMLYAPIGIAQFPDTGLSVKVVLAIVLLGLVCTATAFMLFLALIAEAGPVRATFITYVNPAVALVFGALILGEAVTVSEVAGFVLILVGLSLATRRPDVTGAPDQPLLAVAGGGTPELVPDVEAPPEEQQEAV
jgi:drug/metabolite transporter (DMT)-like permease